MGNAGGGGIGVAHVPSGGVGGALGGQGGGASFKHSPAAWGCRLGYDVVRNRMHNHTHEQAPPSLTKAQSLHSGPANTAVPKTPGNGPTAPAPVLGQARACPRRRFRTARAQRGNSAHYDGVSPGNTPENHPPTEACMIHSNQHRGCRLQDPRTHGTHQTTPKNPWRTSRGCGVQNSGPWDPWLPGVGNSRLFRTARAQRTVRPPRGVTGRRPAEFGPVT